MGVDIHNQVPPVRLALFRSLLLYFPAYKGSWHANNSLVGPLGVGNRGFLYHLYPLDDWPDESNHPSTDPSVGMQPDRPNLTEYLAVARAVRISLDTQPHSNNTSLPASWIHEDDPLSLLSTKGYQLLKRGVLRRRVQYLDLRLRLCCTR